MGLVALEATSDVFDLVVVLDSDGETMGNDCKHHLNWVWHEPRTGKGKTNLACDSAQLIKASKVWVRPDCSYLTTLEYHSHVPSRWREQDTESGGVA